MAGTLAMSFAAIPAFWWWHHQQRSPSLQMEDLIQQAAWRHGVDPTLLKAVIRQESGFNPDARGAAGERGLMQIMPGAAQDWQTHQHRTLPTIEALFDPQLNLEIGAWYLGRALQQWSAHPEREKLALLQYNAGRSQALRAVREQEKNLPLHIPIESTRHYIKNVLSYRADYLEHQTGKAAHGQASKSHP